MREELLNLLKEEEIRNLIKSRFGDRSVEILEELIKRGEEIDLVLTSDIGMEANNLRRILYKMYDSKIVDYREERKKDIAWIDYYWKVREKGLLEFLKRELLNKREYYLKLIDDLEYNELFYCKKCNSIYDYSMAISLDFKCPKDGEELEFYDKKEEILNQYKLIVNKLTELINKIESLEREVIRLKR